jgi:hypothetical protein
MKNLNSAKYGLYPDPELEIEPKFCQRRNPIRFGSSTLVFSLSSILWLVYFLIKRYGMIPTIEVGFPLPAWEEGGVKLCTIHRTGFYIIPYGTGTQYFSSFAAGVSRISISSYGAASSMKTSRLPLPQQQQQQQQGGGKRSTSMGPRERSLNRNPLPSLTPVGRKCK